MDQNPYESPKVESSDSTGWHKFGTTVPYIVLGLIAAVVSSLIFAFAGAAALGESPWELSRPNWQFVLVIGIACSIPGAVIGMVAYAANAAYRLCIALGCIAIWSVATSVGFYFFISIFMMG